MAFCTECGTANEATVKFCTACGARLEAVVAPSAVGLRRVGASAGFEPGEIMVLAGAGAVVISFFLPWFSEPPELRAWGGLFPGMGGFRRPQSISGVGLFNLLGASVLLVPLLAALAAAFVLIFREASRAAQVQAAGWQILFAAPNVTNAITLLFLPMIPTVLSVGFYGATLGYLAILVGSFVRLHQLARTAQGGGSARAV